MRQIVVVIIRDKNGNYFVHRRRSDKGSFPDRYGLGAGGRVEVDESPRAAATRELWEETGVRCQPSPLFEFVYQDDHVAQRLHVFKTSVTCPIPNHDEEWQWSGWLAERDVDALRDSGALCPDTAMLYDRYRDLAVLS